MKRRGRRFLKKYNSEQFLFKLNKAAYHLGFRIKDHMPVLVKRVPSHAVLFWDRIKTRRVPSEVVLHSKTRRIDGVLKCLDFYQNQDHFTIVKELSKDCATLEEYLDLKRGVAKDLFRQLVVTLQQCHQVGVYYCDLSDESILVDLNTHRLKIGMFPGMTESQYLKVFTPPEVMSHHSPPHLYAMTIWNIGVILYRMVCGEVPFQTMKDALKGQATYDRIPDEACKDLLQQCLSLDMNQRPSFEAILNHPWWKEDESSYCCDLKCFEMPKGGSACDTCGGLGLIHCDPCGMSRCATIIYYATRY